ncbi:MAG TPA: M14 family zinc carboxypeptidase [Rhodocyclaceae bacterium]|nr:M14 family zinc carboxypeptidase [Rhodocyclaceae bacterium]
MTAVFPVTLTGLPELLELQRILDAGVAHLDAKVVCTIKSLGQQFPVHAITLGNPSPDVPAIGFFGGFHGLERIGSEVVIAYLGSLVTRLEWDATLHHQLESVRLVFMPIVNPGGMWQGTRANPNGVDLMRNAPVDAIESVPFLMGGQRISARLPWYRGAAASPMEAENLAVCKVVEEELLARVFSIAIDCHSGFGIHDRIWFPYAHTSKCIEHLPEIHALRDIFESSHPNHRYVFEPQSTQYLTHGDVWDHLYQRACSVPGRIFLPLTLELGSWLWIKKNPRQLFSRHGIFNPLVEHRRQRVIRRQMAWLDFLARAACSYRSWTPKEAQRDHHLQRAMSRWYEAGSQ